MSIIIAVALLGVLALFSGSAVFQISRNLRQDDQQKRLESLDADVANLLSIPQMCTCNMIKPTGLAVPINVFANGGVTTLNELDYFTDPPDPTKVGAASCTKPDTTNFVIKTGQPHSESQMKVLGISIGPFYPLGPSNTNFPAQDYLANISVKIDGLEHPFETKILVATYNGNIQFCGKRTGQVPIYSPPVPAGTAYSGALYRYSQFSLNFACPNPAPPALPSSNQHPAQSEPYIFTRNQYFWPYEEGDFITEFEVGRIANAPLAPVGFATLAPIPPATNVSTFAGASTCFQELGIGDSVKLVVPTYNEYQCDLLTTKFVQQPILANGGIVDVGFSLVDNCSSRFQ